MASVTITTNAKAEKINSLFSLPFTQQN
jgi:hypothetical protein